MSEEQCRVCGRARSVCGGTRCYEPIETETVAELRAKLDKVTLELEFTRQYLNPEDTSFRQMCDTFATFTPMQKNRLIDLASALKNVSLAENV